MKVLGVIPARYSSTRFPGKPLVVIDGKSMIQRVYEQAISCSGLSSVIVATDDRRIEKHVFMTGGKSLMTSVEHNSGTERCSEVYRKLRRKGQDYDLVVNIQGDEPFIHPEQIEQVISCFTIKDTMIASLMKKITSGQEINDPNVVKVVTDTRGKALYFSRATIPYIRDKGRGTSPEQHSFFKHIGIFGYRPDILMKIVKLPPSRLEVAESLEQLRWLYHGYDIILKETAFESLAIDTPADLLKLTNRE